MKTDQDHKTYKASNRLLRMILIDLVGPDWTKRICLSDWLQLGKTCLDSLPSNQDLGLIHLDEEILAMSVAVRAFGKE